MTEFVIDCEGLTRRFGATLAVDSLSLKVKRGEIFGFLGHNGAGKTTSVRLLNGVLAPDSGQAWVLGLSPVENGPELRRQTGVLTETPSLDERLSAYENLTIYGRLFGLNSDDLKQRVSDLLEVFGLADRAQEKTGGYSKGMKQRLALARALLHRPQLLFLDEPTSGLDPVSRRQVHEMITQLSQEEGHSVFLCTHNLEEAQRLCHRVAVMEKGRMVAVGSPAELARQLGIGLRFTLEFAPNQLAAAEQFTGGLADVSLVATDKSKITIDVDDRERIPDLIEALVGAGLRVYEVAPQSVSLEDIYFALQTEKTL